ncbi:MAG TPA: hypothetical protein V6C58_07155 [Allocoleopsis sp.]
MAYVTKYYSTFENAAGKTIKLELQYDGFGGTATEFVSTSCELSYPDGDLSKESGIKSSQLDFSIYTQTPELFTTTSATECKVLLSINGTTNWVGWLDNTVFKFDLQDYVNIKLSAKDGLHLMESVDDNWMLNFGTNGLFTPVDLIAKCLTYTEFTLDFYTWIDIYPDTFQIRGAGGDTVGANDPMDSFNIHSTVFQEGMRKYNDPFAALNKLCRSFNAIFFQARGQWHFVYLEDWIRNLGLTGTRWDYLGVAQSYAEYQRERVNVGITRGTKLIDGNALVGYIRPVKKCTTNYYFNNPDAVIKNLDLNDTTGSPSSGAGYDDYTLADWTVISGTAVTRVFLDSDGNEQRRVLFLNGSINSSSGLVGSGDYFNFEFTFSKVSPADLNVGIRVVNVTGVSTTYYYLKGDGKWVTGTSTWQLIGLGNFTVNSTFNIANVDPIPANGLMEIRLSGGVASIWNMGLDYTYKPINKFTASGYYHESSQTTDFKSNLENIIFISDTTGIATRGAMMFKTFITPLEYWKHRGVTEKIKFSKIINRALYKSNYRNFYTLEGSMLFNFDGDYLFSPLNTFLFDEFSGLEFMCCTLRVDLINDKSEATFVELLNTSNSDDFDEVGTEIFKYLDYKADKLEILPEFVPDNRKGVIGYIIQAFTGLQSVFK